MTQRRLAVLVILLACLLPLALASCGGAKSSDPRQIVEDRELTAQRRLARAAFENGQYAQAVALYEQALARSYARDDVLMIGDVGYESALALLRQGEPAKATERAQKIETELSRRGKAPFAELYLVEATSLYASGDAGQALRAIETTVAAPDAAPEVKARAEYLRGMIAADRGDGSTLGRALATLGESADKALQADRLELLGRERLLQADTAGALSAFQGASELRRDTRDYVGVARTLAFSAAASETAGQRAAAAEYYLRAGRAAQSDGRPAMAKPWLEKAARLAREADYPSVLREARERLASIGNATDQTPR